MKVLTIGAYGYDEASFFQALKDAGVDIFCDVRQRRGMRGSEYAFANSSRLQKRLEEIGIRYLHATALAPPTEVRDIQRRFLKTASGSQRASSGLSPEFIEAYTAHCLDRFDVDEFLQHVGECQTVCLFCVEREPQMCHRSLAAEYVANKLGCEVRHLIPTE